MPDPTYESEINQPVHRPGMEGVVNRGSMASSDDEPRHVVSPPTQSAFGPASASDPAPKTPPKSSAGSVTSDDDSPGASRESRQRERNVLQQADDQS